MTRRSVGTELIGRQECDTVHTIKYTNSKYRVARDQDDKLVAVKVKLDRVLRCGH